MRRGNASVTSEQNVRAREREARSLELLKAGATYEQIASAVGYRDPSGAWRAVMRALGKVPNSSAKELRKVDSERCERLFLSLRAGIERGDPRAIEAAVRVLSHKAKLNGYMAPERHELSEKNRPTEQRVRTDHPIYWDPGVRAAIRAVVDRTAANPGAYKGEEGPSSEN